MVKYVVRLPTEERARLLTLVNTGQAAAAKLLHARLLLKADLSVGVRHWTEAEIAEALDPSPSTVHRVRQAWGACGLEAALARKRPTGRQYRKLDGAQEAQLLAITCSAPPAGRTRWTFNVLADKLVALAIGATVSAECVRTTLKKMRLNRGSRNSG